VIYITAKIQESRMHLHQMEKLDATGKDAMFGENDINFDLQLEKFGVDTSILKEPAVQRNFALLLVFRKTLRPPSDEDKMRDATARTRSLIGHARGDRQTRRQAKVGVIRPRDESRIAASGGRDRPGRGIERGGPSRTERAGPSRRRRGRSRGQDRVWSRRNGGLGSRGGRSNRASSARWPTPFRP